MDKFARITWGSGFAKDLKKLLKKHRSLEEDLELFIKAQLFAFHKLNIDNHGIFQIRHLGFERFKIYKAKKFACKSLKGKGANSGIRIIYPTFRNSGVLDPNLAVFQPKSTNFAAIFG